MLSVTFNEIALKGKNKRDFERVLRENIKYDLENNLIKNKLKHFHNEIRIEFENKDDEKKAISILKNIFGITYIYKHYELEKNLKQAKSYIKKIVEDYNLKNFFLRVKRIDKSFEKTSPEIFLEFIKDLEKYNPERESENIILLKITKTSIELLYRIEKGPSGLPVGSLGKVVSLVSGGIDSPVASWLMMKRGCEVILFHVSSFDKEENKVRKLFNALKKYSSGKIDLIIKTRKDLFGNVCHSFVKDSIEDRYKCVLFKNMITEIAQEICYERGALGIVNGDNLGQVASQTLENLRATRYNIELPIYSPLITYNKEEIIKLAKKIGTYDISIEEEFTPDYIPKHPITKANLNKFLKIKKDLREKLKK